MLGFKSPTNHEPKCNVTHGTMGHIDRDQPPTKRKPFATILNHNFIQKVEMLLPQELYEIIQREVLSDETVSQQRYSKVVMPLKGLLTGDFFNEYIRKGNIMMLSEGKVGVDNVYRLKDGVLKLHLDKESYERAGLVGKPDGVKAGRGTKPWWVVEINLRLPSMLHGRKAFDRVLYAFKNVLTSSVTWLFHDLGKESLASNPLDLHTPIRKSAIPQTVENISVNMPSLTPPTDHDPNYGNDFEDFAVETHEWLSLALLESPRLNTNDKIDSFLSRYTPPGETVTQVLVKISWQGFTSPSWAHSLFVRMVLATPKEQWFAYSLSGFAEGWATSGHHSMILKLPSTSSDYVLMDVK